MNGFVERELDRLRAAILDYGNAERRDAPYAAQQALEWAREPNGFAPPLAVAMGIQEAREDCRAVSRPPLP